MLMLIDRLTVLKAELVFVPKKDWDTNQETIPRRKQTTSNAAV
jgi:hypothetical protein